MSKDENKTKPTSKDVLKFINEVENEQRRADALQLLRVMRELTRLEPVMWGPSIIGFGSYHYKYESGREGDMIMTGFSPRKSSTTVYLMDGFDRHETLLDKLGPHKTGKSCLYIKRLSDIDLDVLKEMISRSIDYVKDNYKTTS